MNTRIGSAGYRLPQLMVIAATLALLSVSSCGVLVTHSLREDLASDLPATDMDEAARAVDALKSSDPEVWIPASLKLETMGERAVSAVTPLCNILADGGQSARVRALAGIALMNIGSPAVKSLSGLLKRVSMETPILAAKLLGELGDPDAAGPLVDFLQKPSAVTDAAFDEEKAKFEDIRFLHILALMSLSGEPRGEIEEEIAQDLEDSVADAARGARVVAAKAIGYLKVPATTDLLLDLFNNEGVSAEARASAATALAALRDPRAVEVLQGALKANQSVAKARIAYALGEIGDLRAVGALESALGDQDGDVRRLASGALARIASPRALSTLVSTMLAETDLRVRWSMMQSLQRTGRALPFHRLLDTLHSDDTQRSKAAVSILARIKLDNRPGKSASDVGGTTTLLAERIEAALENPETRQRAADKLSELRIRGRSAALIESLGGDDSQKRRTAVMATLNNGPAAVSEVLMGLLANQEQMIPEEALSELKSPERSCWVKAMWRLQLMGERAMPAAGRLIELLAAQHNIRSPHGIVVSTRDEACNTLVQIGPDTVGLLISALNDPAKAEYAAKALGDLKDSRAVNPLIAFIKNGSPAASTMAAKALGKIKVPQTAEALIAVLNDRSLPPRVRRFAADALGNLRGPQAVVPLLNALEHDGALVKEGAATALGCIRDLRAVEPLSAAIRDDRDELRRKAGEALAMIGGSRPLTILSTAVGVETVPFVKMGILGAIRKEAWINNRSVPLGVVINSLKDKKMQNVAGRMLGMLADEIKADIIIFLLKEPKTSLYAVRALKRSRDPRVVEPLIRALGSSNTLVRIAAAERLGEMRDRRSVAPLIDLLASEDRRLAATAAEALGKIGDNRAEGPLRRTLDNPEAKVGFEFPQALLRLNRRQKPDFYVAALRVRSFWKTAIDALKKTGEPAFELLLIALEDEDPIKRSGAARVLGHIGGERATGRLIKALNDHDTKVRMEAMVALALVGDERASKVLEKAFREGDSEVRRHVAIALSSTGRTLSPGFFSEALEDEDPVVRELAVKALGERGNIEALIKALGDENKKVREVAIWKIKGIGSPAVDSLVAATKHTSERVRAAAALCLAELGDSRTVESLTAALKDPAPEVRVNAAYALKKIGDSRSVPRLIEALHDEAPAVRLEAVFALRKFKDPRSLEPLLAAVIEDPNDQVASVAATSFCGSNNKRAVDQLVRLLKHRSGRVREYAAAGLGCLGDFRAVGPLIQNLGSLSARGAKITIRALEQITGEDFGTSIEKWQTWWEGKKGGWPADR